MRVDDNVYYRTRNGQRAFVGCHLKEPGQAGLSLSVGFIERRSREWCVSVWNRDNDAKLLDGDDGDDLVARWASPSHVSGTVVAICEAHGGGFLGLTVTVESLLADVQHLVGRNVTITEGE